MSIIQGNAHTSAGGGGFQIERSLRFNSADSAYLNRTPASAGNRRTFTWSGWVKRGALSSSASYFLFAAGSFAGSTNTSIRILNDSINIYWGGTGGPQWTATAVLRDPSAWYHLVFAFDTTQATFGNRLKLYVNGVQSTVWSLQESTGLTAQNSDLYINNNQQHNLGASGTPGNYFDGYMTEVNFIDGQALTPSSFGETDSNTGVWKPKAFSGTYGNNGFYLKFADNSGTTSTTLGKDSSGNGNNWTPNNFSVTAGAGNDSLVDSPTSYGTDTGVGGTVRGNYCTVNPLDANANVTLSNGNLDIATGSSYGGCRGTIAVSSGKWYWEVTPTSLTGGASIGIWDTSEAIGTNNVGATAKSYAYWNNGQKQNNNTNSAYGASYTTNDVIGVALDLDAGTLVFYKNNSSQGTAFSSLSGNFAPGFGDTAGASSSNLVTNFGQRAFAYTAPSGFKALCTQNLPTPTIGATSTTQANDYFNPLIWLGNGVSARSLTGVGFAPDLVWLKNRSAANSHLLYDIVRGPSTSGSSKALQSNSTTAEGSVNDNATFGYLSSFDSDGFSVVNGSTGAYTNVNNENFVAWNWKAGSSNVTNTAGTITSTVRANTTSGFSIVTYTGTGANATVGHGLGVAPDMVIVKGRNTINLDWVVYHRSLTSASYALFLNATNAQTLGTTYWNSTAPTSTVFSVGADNNTNKSATTYVAYCFDAVAGYSAFGSYTGNNTNDNAFVYLGFRPEFIMIKCSSTGGINYDWIMFDVARMPYNYIANTDLRANLPSAEGGTSRNPALDILSNGFKVRGSGGEIGQSQTYIYAAFAESPFKYSLGR